MKNKITTNWLVRSRIIKLHKKKTRSSVVEDRDRKTGYEKIAERYKEYMEALYEEEQVDNEIEKIEEDSENNVGNLGPEITW